MVVSLCEKMSFFGDLSEVQESELCSVFTELSSIQADPPPVRSVCQKCRRPMVSCWCCYLPKEPLTISTHVYILQHPFEETRSLQTAPMLSHGLPDGHCRIFKGKRFFLKKLPQLHAVLEQPNTILLFPGPKAVNIETYLAEQKKNDHFDGHYNLLVLDGTWHQARGIYCQNSFLHDLTQVQLSNSGLSKYVIRTQPTDSGLSTVETVAMAIGMLEDKPDIFQGLFDGERLGMTFPLLLRQWNDWERGNVPMALTRPLDALCEDQLKHGAVKHHSKQYLIENGLYVKQKSHLIGLKRKEEKERAKQKNNPSRELDASVTLKNSDKAGETTDR